MISIFNRSHYEDVLVVRVHDLLPETVWRRRYAAINNFEQILTQHDMLILKFYLHISSEEKEKRLLSRHAHKNKTWKHSWAYCAQRQKWNKNPKTSGGDPIRRNTEAT